MEYILRYLLQALSQTLVKYLVYIRLFSQVIGQKEWDYLFIDERGLWAGNQLSTVVVVVTTRYLGVRLTILVQRQVTITITNEHLSKVVKTWDREEGEEEGEEFIEGEDEVEVELNILDYILV